MTKHQKEQHQPNSYTNNNIERSIQPRRRCPTPQSTRHEVCIVDTQENRHRPIPIQFCQIRKKSRSKKNKNHANGRTSPSFYLSIHMECVRAEIYCCFHLSLTARSTSQLIPKPGQKKKQNHNKSQKKKSKQFEKQNVEMLFHITADE